jgi:lipoyl-dependent peroxiredoxin
MQRRASAVWSGNIQEGIGTISTESGVIFAARYASRRRFADGEATDPDELIAASLGGCFSMELASALALSGYETERIETVTTATLEQLTGGWTMTRMQLDVHARVPKATQSDFIDAALAAKIKCPVARLLNTTISMTARLDP